jgi:hypothetical protein
MGGGSSK